jgi:plastocyanin
MFSPRRRRSCRRVIQGAGAFAALLLLACGGNSSNRTPSNAGASTAAPAPPPPTTGATPSPATGKTWDVKMLGDASGYRYDPVTLSIKAGDAVRWTVVSGPPHNVTFWADSIPKGASAPLQADMPQTMAPLTGPLLNTPAATYTITFANVPPGTYDYYCTPHLALGMKGKLTINP